MSLIWNITVLEVHSSLHKSHLCMLFEVTLEKKCKDVDIKELCPRHRDMLRRSSSSLYPTIFNALTIGIR